MSRIPLRGGPADGRMVNFHEGRAIEITLVGEAGEYYRVRYAVERVNGKPVYATYQPPRGLLR